MKIINRETFLALPAGTVYAKFEPHMFGETCVKGDTVAGVDWYYAGLNSPICTHNDTWADTILFNAMETGCSVSLDFETETRDGLFDQEQLFAVWESVDVRQLISRLQQTLKLRGERHRDT